VKKLTIVLIILVAIGGIAFNPPPEDIERMKVAATHTKVAATHTGNAADKAQDERDDAAG
jgi:hypothetical protein